MGRQIRLSQCMIVKNEEKNIERALSWGKGTVCEQIVVDTGSTDRTVEVAEAMGAKVLHFKWVDDFAAAKNFAIDHASGDWIAFLDADEYFKDGDAGNLLRLLSRLEREVPDAERPQIVRCRWVQLNDAGVPFADAMQDRIFRNLPGLRYHGKIHELLGLEDGGGIRVANASDVLDILHTGYSDSAYEDTNKAQRNADMLRAELEGNPDNYDAMSYLVDALLLLGEQEEAEAYMRKIASVGDGRMDEVRRASALIHLLKLLTGRDSPGDISMITSLYNKILLIDPQHPDPHYLLAVWMMNQKRLGEAKFHLEAGLEKMEHYRGTGVISIVGDLKRVYLWLTQISFALKLPPDTVRYGTLSLRADRYQAPVLEAILSLLRDEAGGDGQPDGVVGFLGKLYDLSQLRDLLFVLKCAKSTGFYSLQERLHAMLPESEREALATRRDPGDPSGAPGLPFPVRNATDRSFARWAESIRSSSPDGISGLLKKKLKELKTRSSVDYKNFVDYYGQYSFWGRLAPDKDEYGAFDARANEVSEHLDDFIWLYSMLQDYRSKRTLLAILLNWTELDMSLLSQVREYTPDYFDPDLIPACEDEVFVDLGAYTGDTLDAFIDAYGTGYRKIYCYEITPEITGVLCRNAARHGRVEVRQKAAGKGAGKLFLSENAASASANALSQDAATEVEVVAIDDDIREAATFIKMDIEGSEKDALLGCRRQIRENHPKLAICAYHGYGDLWRIPRMVQEISPGYRFYLRHYGGNMIPTEFVLYAI